MAIEIERDNGERVTASERLEWKTSWTGKVPPKISIKKP